eukprot:TRINITY_DN3687_c1_g1_i1.p1 TRINITY_DN3687_c1_g1~~TRINITY_DN3687_c1_g1_i1.p1  ORF type:complete len:474 (+),score=94.11 TRINITY_DN3687_c1_g1_i1:153-1574(+)
MEGQRTMRMLLQTMPKKGFVLTFFVFLLLFIVCIIIGAVGPAAYDSIFYSAYDCPNGGKTYDPITCNGVDLTQNGSSWSGEIFNLTHLSQELYLTATIDNKNTSAGIDAKYPVRVISIEGRDSSTVPWNLLSSNVTHQRTLKCPEGRSQCDTITIVHEIFVQYSSYRVNASFDFTGLPTAQIGDVIFEYYFVDHQYTLFELWFRFTFLIITIAIIITYAHRLKSYSYSEWTFEQKWGAGLLFGLLAYDNPFYPMEILANGWFPIFLNRLLYASFIVLLLFFWLTLFDGIRMEASQRNFKSFYLPKILLLGAFWICGIVVYTWSQLHQRSDPVYNTASDLPGYIFFQVFFLILLIVYIFWLVYSTCRTCGDMKTLPYLGVRIKFFGVFTLLVMLTVVGGLIFGIGTALNSAVEWLSFFALANLYVYVLAFVYLPSQVAAPPPTEETTERIGMVRLDEDEQEVDVPSVNVDINTE